MNVFYRYTRKTLAKNRARTLVTIIGIVLSMALFTAVIEGAYSGLQFMVRGEEEMDGAFQAAVSDLSDADVAALQSEQEIDRLNLWREVGWARFDTVASMSMPYLLIMDVRNGSSLAPIRLKDGRMPETDTELIFPSHLNNYLDTPVRVGDQLTLTVGSRMIGGAPAKLRDYYQPDTETIENAREITYTVVGVCERLPSQIEPYECPGFMALTVGGGSGSSLALLTVRHPARAYDFFQALYERCGLQVQAHDYLLAFYGGVRSSGLHQVIYGLATILVLLIAFGSISLIYNSFSISVSERTKQIGILKSVGATRKQIRGAVLYEALLLSAIAIPIGLIVGCVGIGLTLYFLRDGFQALVGRSSSVHMQLVISPAALLIAALVCLLTTLISAWIPALRAVRITPMQAIRQSEDIKLSRRDVKSSRLTQKLFGFAGTMAAKNFRRNRKRYRATVISLFLSVVLFISASTFCAYLRGAVNNIAIEGTVNSDITYVSGYRGEGNSAAEADRLFDLLMSCEHVTEGVYFGSSGGSICFPESAVSASARDSERAYFHGGLYEHETLLIFLQDEAFRTLCRENGLDAAVYFDENQPVALFKNHVTDRYYDEEGSHWEDFELLQAGSVPLTAVRQTVKYELEGGWQLMDNYNDETFVYYPADYVQSYWQTHDNGDEMDQSQARILTKDEATDSVEFTVGVILKQGPDCLSGDTRPALIYPYSLRSAVLPGELDDSGDSFMFQTDDHAAAYTAMRQALTDAGMNPDGLFDQAEQAQSERMVVTIVDVFSYGFIILISLIAAANVFNTVSTSISLRRRELAMLQSIGLGRKDFYRMMNYECLIYGFRALLWGLPAAGLVSYAIYKTVGGAFDRSFYIPWYSVAIAVGSVFAVVFASMLYAAGRIRRENPIDALKLETL